MAYAIVGQTSGAFNTAAGSTATTGTYSVTSGNDLICFVYYQTVGGANSVVSITDDVGGNDTWTRVASSCLYNDPYGVEVYICNTTVTSASTTFTVTLNANSFTPALAVFEISGLNHVSTVIANAVAFQSSPGTGTDAVSTGASGTLSEQPAGVLALTLMSSPTTLPSAGTGYMGLAAVMDFGSGPYAVPEHMRVTATSAVTATWTATNGFVNYLSSLVALRESSGGYIPPRPDWRLHGPIIAQ